MSSARRRGAVATVLASERTLAATLEHSLGAALEHSLEDLTILELNMADGTCC